MTFSIRMRLDPIFDEDNARLVVGLTPSFTLLGAVPTNAKRDDAVQAELEFVGRFAATVRDHPTPDEESLGKLSGELTLLAGPARVEFVCDPDSLKQLTEEPESPPPSDSSGSDDPPPEFSPKNLRLDLGEAFDGLDALENEVPRLFLPDTSGKFRYLEVFVRLTVSGAIEAELEQSDVLDVLISPEPLLPYPFSL